MRGPRPRVQHIPRNFDAALGEIMTVKNTQGRKTPTEDDVFTFEWKGEKYALPKFGNWPMGLFRRVRRLDDADATFTILEAVASPEVLAVIDEMTPDEFGKVMSDWQAHAGVTLGESGSSSS